MQFSNETPDDEDEVEALLDLCFAPGRQALSSYKLREGVDVLHDVSMVCRDETGGLIGAIRYWPVMAAGMPCLLLGPIAVHPIAQGEGIAAILIRRTLDLAREAGWDRVILIGDAPYYGRYGFTRDMTLGLEFPPPTNPDRFLGLELVEGALRDLKGDIEKMVV